MARRRFAILSLYDNFQGREHRKRHQYQPTPDGSVGGSGLVLLELAHFRVGRSSIGLALHHGLTIAL